MATFPPLRFILEADGTLRRIRRPRGPIPYEYQSPWLPAVRRDDPEEKSRYLDRVDQIASRVRTALTGPNASEPRNQSPTLDALAKMLRDAYLTAKHAELNLAAHDARREELAFERDWRAHDLPQCVDLFVEEAASRSKGELADLENRIRDCGATGDVEEGQKLILDAIQAAIFKRAARAGSEADD